MLIEGNHRLCSPRANSADDSVLFVSASSNGGPFDLPSQSHISSDEAFGIPTTDTIGGLLEANSLAGDAQPIIQALGA
eukprot:139836-Amphidinium_carterae.1